MGNGYMLKCSKCEKNYEVVEGTGMTEAKGILNAAKHGNYGEEYKHILCESDDVSIDTESYIYICDICGHWKLEPDLSIYRKLTCGGNPNREGAINIIEWI